MSDNENPWKEFDYEDRKEYVLKSDKDDIEALKKIIEKKCGDDKKKDEFQLRLNLLPEPFVGSKDAPIYLLNLNPGYDEMNDEEKEVIKEYIIRNNRQENEKDEYPFYWLDPKLRDDLKALKEKPEWKEKFKKLNKDKYKNGCEWWEEKLNGLLKAVEKTTKSEPESYKLVSKNIFCIEYFPYHSKKWFEVQTDLDSQKYSINLIKNAIKDKDKIFIIMRHKTELFKRIKSKDKQLYEDLVAAENKGRVFRCFSSQNPCITEDNIGMKAKFNEEIVDRIRK